MPSLAIEAARIAWPPLAAAPIAGRRGSRSACCGAVRPARVVPHGCGQLQFTKHFTELFKRFHGSGRGMASCCDSCGQLRLLRLAAACCGLLRSCCRLLRSCCRLLRSCCCLLRLVEVLLRLVALGCGHCAGPLMAAVAGVKTKAGGGGGGGCGGGGGAGDPGEPGGHPGPGHTMAARRRRRITSAAAGGGGPPPR